jgi:hypothetical protein
MSDPGLDVLSSHADAHGATCPITLVVSGNMVTGHVVGKDSFEADTSRMVDVAQEQAGAEDGAVEAFSGMMSAMLDAVNEADGETFLHVSVQEVMTGAEAIHLGGSVFRFRADDIEGYTIGTVETTEG